MIVQGAFPSGRTLTLNVQRGHLTVSFDPQTVLTYDRAGRLWSAFIDGLTYRRGYNGRVMVRQTVRGQRQRRWLEENEADALLARAGELAQTLDSVAWAAPPSLQTELSALIALARSFTPAAAARDAQRFNSIYTPLGILPPDQYLALVLQLSEGCSFNTCTFCTCYRGRPFRIKPQDEFRAHVQAVLDYIGPALPMRKSIFLADANALVAPHSMLIEALALLRRMELPPLGVYAFLDGFSGARKSAGQYAELGALGLKRVYIGLESGHDPLLKFLNKPGCAADAMAAARAIKAGGLSVCVIILLGAGGVQFAKGHICDTIEAIKAMSLDARDLIYFSEFIAQPGQPYGQIAARYKVEPLSPAAMRDQRRAIQAGLPAGPKISTYDIREFVY